MLNLAGKTALVTGATVGIGGKIAKARSWAFLAVILGICS